MPSADLWTVKRMLDWATSYFDQKGLESPRLLIEWVLADALNIKRLDVYLNYDRPLTTSELDHIRPKVSNLSKGTPLQYVLGYEQFYNLTIYTDHRALIPRPETEELVDYVIQQLDEKSEAKILDLGTGTGCIPLAIKANRPKTRCIGIDLSDDALSLAKENARQLSLDVRFVKANIANCHEWPKEKKVDILISNPPYIHASERDSVDNHVHNHEPHMALYTDDVISMYLNIVDWVRMHLSIGGSLFIELNPLFAETILKLFQASFIETKLLKDLNEKSRFLVGLNKK